jgi:hypothetical protein
MVVVFVNRNSRVNKVCGRLASVMLRADRRLSDVRHYEPSAGVMY